MQVLTNQEFLYRESPTEEDGLAKITDIKGNTLNWNQLQQSASASQTTNGITYTVNNDGSITANGTATATSIFYLPQIGQLYANHKYLAKGCPSGGTAQTYMLTFRCNSFSTVLANDVGNGAIANGQNYNDGNMGIRIASGVTLSNAKFYPQVFDLTQMGLDISSPSDFTSLFPLPYYAYNQGTLLSFMGNGIKTVGFNQWDEEWEVGAYNSADGSKADNVRDRIRNKNPIRIFPSVNYYKNKGLQVYYYDASMNFVGWNSLGSTGIFTPPSNARYMNFNGLAGTGTTYNNDICINISSSRNGEYEPYSSSTLSLPISTYFPNGMKSAGNVYDELTETKAITRIGSVDLGSLTWTYLKDGIFRTSAFPNVKTDYIPNWLTTADYQVASATNYAGWKTRNMQMGFLVGYQFIIFMNTSYTDATTFKSAMNGVYLYYELATPTETSFTTASLVTENAEIPYPFFKTYKGGTEQILPENGSVPTTAPIICDLKYSSGIVQVTTYPNPEQGGETSGDGWYLVGEEATVNATPNEHYAFNNWVLDGEIVSTDPEYTFEVQDE